MMHNFGMQDEPRVIGWSGHRDYLGQGGSTGRGEAGARGRTLLLGRGDRRLPVTRALIRAGSQPPVHACSDADGVFCVIDGEVYNWDVLDPGTDPEHDPARRLLDLYRIKGPAVFTRMDAAAGVTLYDAGRRMLYVLRDAVGSVPVYYAETDKALLWSSEIKGLLAMGIVNHLDLCALDYYMTSGYIPAPWTLVRAIWKIPPGHMVSAREGERPRLESYWRPSAHPVQTLGEGEITGRLATLIPRAVERRYNGMPGDGLLLSGGVDSMTLAALMAKQAHSPVAAFTFRYLDYDGVYNEGAGARACAEHLGLRHHLIDFGPEDIITGLDRMLAAYGEPFSYGLHSFKLHEVRGLGIEALLCGTGADGWFPGRRDLAARRLLQLIYPFKGIFNAGVQLYRPVEAFCSRQDWLPGWLRRRGLDVKGALWSAYGNLPYYLSDYLTGPTLRRQLYRHGEIVDQGLNARRNLLDQAVNDYIAEDHYHRFRFLSMRLFGADMMQNWNHWSGRAHGLSIRAPYYDRELLAFVHRLPVMARDKRELRRYASTLLPPQLAYRLKVPQSVPLGHWLRGPLREFACDSLSRERLHRLGLFNPEAVAQVLAEHMQGKKNHDWTIWGLLMVTAWQDMHRRGVVPPVSGADPLGLQYA